MADRFYVLRAFLVMAAATFPTRVFPFLVPKKYRNNAHLKFIGLYLPPAVMLLLVLYCLQGANFSAVPYGIPEILSIVVVVAAHLWKRHGLLSIGLGTLCYVFLVQTGIIERWLALL